MNHRQVRYGSLCALVAIFVAVFALIAGCSDKKPGFYQKVAECSTPFDLNLLSLEARSNADIYTVIMKMAWCMESNSDFDYYRAVVDRFGGPSRSEYRTRAWGLLVTLNKRTSIVLPAYQNLPDSLRQQQRSQLVDKSLADGQVSFEQLTRVYDICRQENDLHQAERLLPAFVEYAVNYGNTPVLLRILPFSSPGWQTAYNHCYLEDKIALYNEESILRPVIYRAMTNQQAGETDWVYVAKNANRGTSLQYYARRQIVRPLTIEALLANYKRAAGISMRQVLAVRIDSICRQNGDTADDWEYVLANSDPNTPLNILAQRRLWDINARPIVRTNLESTAQFAVPHSTGLAASRPPTTSNGIALEWQTLRPIYRLEVSVPDTSGCPPTPWGVIKTVYRATPWRKITPIYRTTSANPVPTKTGAIESKRQPERSQSRETKYNWGQLRSVYRTTPTDSTSQPVRRSTWTWGELRNQYR